MNRTRLPGRRAQATLDAVLALWAVLWVAVGIAVAHEVRGLAELSTTVSRVGRATQAVGEALRSLPLIGGSAGQISDAGSSAVASAKTARENARSVGTLLGVSIALIPSLPVLVLYVPGRIGSARERRALARAVAAGEDPNLSELLARRALVHLPYTRLRRISDDPLGDLAAGRHSELARAELDWFGVPSQSPVSR